MIFIDLLFLLAATSFIPHALADFHIATTETFDNSGLIATYRMQACPSNYYNCECFGNGDREGSFGDVNYWGDFTMDAGFCGMGKMDFYPDGDALINFYISGGDGTAIGYCTPNTGDSLNCWTGPADGTVTVFDEWYCHSYVCN